MNNLSIEQMREIVNGAPDKTATHCVINTGVNYYSLSFGSFWDYDIDDWNDSDYSYTSELIGQFGVNSVFDLNDLRTAIAKNDKFKVGDLVVDSTGFFDWLCKVDYLSSDGRVVMYKHDKSKNDRAYQTWPNIETVRHATPEEIKAGHRIDDTTDHVTDIRNHVSPSTRVVDL